MSDHELDYELEMDDIDDDDDDDDDVMDDAAEFDIPQNAELNYDQVPEIENKRALTYQKAFDRLCDDPSFKLNVREEEIDEEFDDVDGFEDIVKLCETDDSELHDMALGMREKFDKYLGDFDKINQMLMFAMMVGELTDNITNGITRLFECYVKNNANLNVRSQEVGGSSDKGDLDGVEMEIDSHKSLKSRFKMHMQKETNMACKSELGKYLAEASEDDSDKFDVLVGGS
ncbi:hypothetical protein RHSIM_Rhsim10G0149600 [Rhododendron simsii]|uniref:Uncharacterized protein n=1 Tax=Rhododendron simsii TaxID=118357 RepID=A0A834GAW7_RHOSS|nr:hypothetical protein RHSIM_Rhsim10G0149600 [Rhododendron simsii]